MANLYIVILNTCMFLMKTISKTKLINSKLGEIIFMFFAENHNKYLNKYVDLKY